MIDRSKGSNIGKEGMPFRNINKNPPFRDK